MPLCTLTLKPEHKPNTPVELENYKDLCSKALTKLLERLGIPAWDKERKIVLGENDQMKLEFTVGGIEYPEDMPREIFDPGIYRIQKAGEEIKDIVGEMSLEIDTYRGSLFNMYSNESESVGSDIKTPEELNGRQAEIRLTVSPEKYAELHATSGGSKEIPTSGEINSLKQLTDRLAAQLSPEKSIEAKTEVALFADSPLAVEVRIDDRSKPLSLENINTIADGVDKVMISSRITEGSSWTIPESGKEVFEF